MHKRAVRMCIYLAIISLVKQDNYYTGQLQLNLK